jgi:hypothetical protein
VQTFFCDALTCETLECVVCGEAIRPPGSAVHNLGYRLRADLQTTADEVLAFDMDALADFIACGQGVGGGALLGPMEWLQAHLAEEAQILSREEALAHPAGCAAWVLMPLSRSTRWPTSAPAWPAITRQGLQDSESADQGPRPQGRKLCLQLFTSNSSAEML